VSIESFLHFPPPLENATDFCTALQKFNIRQENKSHMAAKLTNKAAKLAKKEGKGGKLAAKFFPVHQKICTVHQKKFHLYCKKAFVLQK